MDINIYNTYSIISMAENKTVAEFQKVLNNLELLNNFKSANEAKKYLQEFWNISENVTSYSLASGLTLNIKETKDLLVINFIYNDENVSYYYNK